MRGTPGFLKTPAPNPPTRLSLLFYYTECPLSLPKEHNSGDRISALPYLYHPVPSDPSYHYAKAVRDALAHLP